MRILPLLLFVILFFHGVASASASLAPNLFKCVAGDGSVSFQAVPCAAGARVAWARNVTPDPAPPRADAEPRVGRNPSERASRSSQARSERSPSRSADAAYVRNNPSSACEAAKARRADLRDRQWRTIRFDQLRELDDEVARACSNHR